MNRPPDAQIINVKALLSKALVIPGYQRPYKWTIKNVDDLINDIISFQDKQAYRLGTVITFKKEIVDGQQRYLTLLLILKALQDAGFENAKKVNALGLSILHFDNRITKHNLQINYQHIQTRIAEFDDILVDFFLEKCEFVHVSISSLGEAFQFFDSQNSRGKALYPHNLLKAFHLRELSSKDEENQLSCIKHWESTDANLLKTIFEDYFFRVRQWSKGKQGVYFSKGQIGVFKGIDISEHKIAPFARSAVMNAKYVELQKSILYDFSSEKEYFPHQLESFTINGELFFDFVKHKSKLVDLVRNFSSPLYQSLKKDSKARMIIDKLQVYPESGRTGDKYCRNLFEVALLYYVDKFGKVQLEKVIPIFFFWAFRPRIKLSAVRLESIDNHARHWNSAIRVIANSLSSKDVVLYKQRFLDKSAQNSPSLIGFFKEQKLV